MTHPTGLFRHIKIWPLGGAGPSNFLHALESHLCLLAHPPSCGEGPPKNFKGEHLKLALKYHICAPITLGVVGVTSLNFTRGCGS